MWIFKTKTFIGIFGAFLFLFGLLALFFSPFGNAYVAEFLCKKLESKTGLTWNVRKFSLTPTTFALDFSAENDKLELFAQGAYSLISKDLEGDFFLNSKGVSLELGAIDDLATFEFLRDKRLVLRDNVWIEGKFSGSFSHYLLQAHSNLLESHSDVSGYFSYLDLQNIVLDVKGGSLALGFEMLGNPIYCDGILDLNLQLHKIPNAQDVFDGSLSVNLDGGELDPAIFLEKFDLKIPQMFFVSQMQGKIHQNTLEYDINMYSSFGDAFFDGSLNIQSFATNTGFDIQLQNLAPFSPFFKIPLGGRLNAKGSASGDMKNMLLQGALEFENSPLTFRLNLQDLNLHTLQMSSQNLQAKSLFTLLNQPTYLDGPLRVNVNLRDFSRGISGVVQVSGENLFVNSPLLEMSAHIGFPSSAFALDSKMELAQGEGIVEYSLSSNFAHFKSQNGKITLQPFAFSLPQEVEIHNLQNLSYRNKSLLQGSLSATGIATQEQLELKGEVAHKSKTYPTSLTLNSKNLNLYLSNLASTQIYILFPKIPHYFTGSAHLHLQKDFVGQTEHINFDVKDLRFQGTRLSKTLHSLGCQTLTGLNGYIYSQLLEGDALQTAILLQNKSTDLQLQSSKVAINLKTGKINGNLKLKCAKATRDVLLLGTTKQIKIQTH